MGFYLDGILWREVKADRNSKHNGVFNVNLTHTFTSVYVPFTEWLLDFAGKPSIEKYISASASLWGLGIYWRSELHCTC